MPTFDNYSASLAIYRRSDLDLTETAVAQAILSFRNADDGRCNPSVFSDDPAKETICTRSKASRRCVLATIQKLEAKGVLRVEKLSGRSSQYVFVDKPSLESSPTRAPDAPVHDVHPCTTGTSPVHDVHPTRAPGAPHPCTTCTRNKERTDKEQIKNKLVDDLPFLLEPDQLQTADRTTAVKIDRTESKGLSDKETAPATKPGPKRKAITHLFELETMPDEWRELCEQIRPDLDPRRVFVEFRFYWMQGKGQGTRRSDKGWTSTWMNWIERQKEQRVQNSRHGGSDLLPNIPFEQRDYGEGINDDHSF